ncbi:MAG: type III secretion fhipep protein [Betaproteobacteria bacterium]
MMPRPLRPACVCEALLAALEAAEGRRKQRKRDQTPDTIGLDVKRRLLRQAVADDPEPETFDAWLMQYVQEQEVKQPSGAAASMARAVLEEWRLAHTLPDFAEWLEHGAPSEDAGPGQRSKSIRD